MLSKEDIKTIHNFNVPLLKVALSQAEQRLQDALNSKENREKKSFSLLTITIGLFTASLAFSRVPFINGTLLEVATLVFSTTQLFIIGFFFLSLKSREYGALGRAPDTWLIDGIINSDDVQMEGYVLANILIDYQELIKKSNASNEKAIRFVDAGLILLILSPVISVLTIFTINSL